MEACTDKPNQAFLLSQLQLCATAAEAPVFVKYAADKYLADYAVRGLISTPGTDGAILALIEQSPAPQALLAYAAAEKRLAAAEPALLKWAANPAADDATKEAVYNALARCGGEASLATLAAAAKAAGYTFTESDAAGAYVSLLARLAAEGSAKALAAAKLCGKPACRRTYGSQDWKSPACGCQKADAGGACRPERPRPELSLRCARLRRGVRRRRPLRRDRPKTAVAERRRGENRHYQLVRQPPRRLAGRDGHRRHRVARCGARPRGHPRRRRDRRARGPPTPSSPRLGRHRTPGGVGRSRSLQRASPTPLSQPPSTARRGRRPTP